MMQDKVGKKRMATDVATVLAGGKPKYPVKPR